MIKQLLMSPIPPVLNHCNGYGNTALHEAARGGYNEVSMCPSVVRPSVPVHLCMCLYVCLRSCDYLCVRLCACVSSCLWIRGHGTT